MVPAMYRQLGEAWRKPSATYVKDLTRQMAIQWRNEPVVGRIEHPTRLDRARKLGYKAKQGFVLVRVRIRRGGARKIRPPSGRRQKAMGVTKFTRAKSLQLIAEERAAKRYENLEVLNSYPVGSDGTSLWYEVILVDPYHPVIKSDPTLSWISGRR